jgi:hypothetical protein
MIQALQRVAAETLPLGRTIVRLTVDAPAPGDGAPRRGFRRVEWIEQALEPLRGVLTPERFERLVSALALVIGWEAQIVLHDVRGLEPAEEEQVLRWAARALVEAALTDQG